MLPVKVPPLRNPSFLCFVRSQVACPGHRNERECVSSARVISLQGFLFQVANSGDIHNGDGVTVHSCGAV